MPFWPFRHVREDDGVVANDLPGMSPQAESAYSKGWRQAEQLYLTLLAQASDPQDRWVTRRLLGDLYERRKRVDEAIALYEANLAEGCRTGSYCQRLAILYHRLGRYDDEKRVLMAAMGLFLPIQREWYAARLAKMK